MTENGNDTWHATKSIGRQMRVITSGAQRNQGSTWHHQLSDKAAPVKTHIYWAMKNCGGDRDQLIKYMDAIPKHYKNDHSDCAPTSRCKTDDSYTPSRTIITDPHAEKLLINFIHKTVVYKNPENYVYAKDTHYCESYNNAVLIYVDKRVGFQIDNYKMRMNLATLDWNEHVDRGATSYWEAEDAAAPRRQQPKANLVRKDYNFRKVLWENFMAAAWRI
ncbi:PREDICTED: uncharacterized protein LOC109486531 [Branchiostoma belcheri]|uniref:Uncharacterized protein LOC109486531 n=1 Tax=Branchiostoma belcheri TaxID=7741 RepID=A0A6P5A8J3_BRABE|nr:PREDICTED: uncharacterized protein LOC109486531 [Branchiostoma belcheri]